MNVEQWVEVFRATGLDDAMMGRWHREFEGLFPAQHDAFLNWLGLAPDQVAQVRAESRTN